MEDKDEEVNQEERDRLLYDLVVRISALETELLRVGVITEKGMAESLLVTMTKVKKVIDDKMNAAEAVHEGTPASENGFIKFGNSDPQNK